MTIHICRFFFIFISMIFPISNTLSATEKMILVSVAPYVTITQEIAGPSFSILLMVPPGISSHSYDPTPKQVLQASHAGVWFCIGESFEPKTVKALQSQNTKLLAVDLRKGLPLIKDEHDATSCLHNHSGYDPHIWTSPKLMILQARTIADTLITVYPEDKDQILSNLNTMIEKLKALDLEISEILSKKTKDSILVAHPTYGYFCREYGLHEYSIEQEGKDPSAKELTEIIKMAKNLGIQTIFAEKQFNIRGAEQIAQAIGASVVILNPYSIDYFEAMRSIAQAFAKSLDAGTYE